MIGLQEMLVIKVIW